MTRPLSNDLRRRVVTAVVDGGMSRRSAARRFGIAPSTAIKWVSAWRRTGSWRPRAQGGDRRSQRIEARAEVVLALLDETPDMTLAEIAAPPGGRARPAGLPERGVALLSPPRHHLQKKPRTPASSNALTCSGAGAPGSKPSPISTLRSSSSSMKQARPPRWRDARAGLRADRGAAPLCPMATGRPQPSSVPSG